MTATDHLAEAIADAVVARLSAAAPPPAATHAEDDRQASVGA